MEIQLYCPSCANRIHRRAISLDFNEIVACPTCSARVRAAKILTSEGKTLLDYFAFLAIQNVNKLGRRPG